MVSPAARTWPRRALLWLNFVCLDAPLVAVGWQWLFARSFHFELSMPVVAALFLTAWFIYAIDRFSDSIFLPADVPKSAREIFCRDHRELWLILIPSIAVADFTIVWSQLDHATRNHGLILAVVTALYLLVNNRFSRIWIAIPIKEITIGTLFAAGTLLSHFVHPRSAIGLSAVLFAVLCALNCGSIAFWERDLDEAQKKHSFATRWPRAQWFAPSASVVVVIASTVFGWVNPDLGPLAICLGLSALLLAMIDTLRLSHDERTALADLVLLTPFAFLFIEKIL